MPKQLPTTDIRAVREYLTNDDFAVAEGPEFVPVGNIDPEVWRSITGLPNDVAIQTTDKRRKEIETANALAVSWLDVVDSLPDGPLKTQSLTCYEAFEASLFNATTGWYRTAGLTMRAGVDDLLTGLFFQINPSMLAEFEAIVSGANQSRKFKEMREALLAATGNNDVFGPKGDFGALYYVLSIYTHRISNSEIWQSNGPIYVREGFDRWFREYTDADRILRAAIDAVRPFV